MAAQTKNPDKQSQKETTAKRMGRYQGTTSGVQKGGFWGAALAEIKNPRGEAWQEILVGTAEAALPKLRLEP